MDKEKLRNDRFLRLIFNNDELLVVDVNSDIWEKILNQKNRIIKIESNEWVWDLSNGEVVFR